MKEGNMLGRGRGKHGLGIMGLLRPALLIQLMQGDKHGYALMDGIEEFNFNFEKIDSSLIYRTLKLMEEDGLLDSYMGEESLGPKRKNYQITEQGKKYLDELVIGLKIRKDEISYLLEVFNSLEKKGFGES